ncbi:MAG: D-alanyl-D-alanine carboxypeptidase/D-alanyl-D-alanine-endopeptidase [Acidobacteriaceae bacterium]|jgi:PBP4 family serine-type D-alanyl-D-alanine carboxypeptidase|nr:D-alanyl-D-alanine carboxypeptidase/D-alanyl-D-alanine-endopeptidase [Acidobacteriaceae bacterium]
MTRHVVAAALTIALVSTAAQRTVPAQSPSAPPAPSAEHDSLRALQQNIAAILASPAAEQASIGIEVRSLQRGDRLVSVNEQKLLMPASAEKIVTLAVAAERLGWDYEFKTDAFAIGAIANGTLTGNLLVVGGGDPTLDNWDGIADRAFAQFAQQLREHGISTIHGDIVGDGSLFDKRQSLGSGWAWDDLASSYATAVSGLQFNQNTAQLAITPGAQAGAPVRIDLLPSYAPVEFRNRATTAATRGVPLTLRAGERSPVVDVSGALLRRAPREVHNVSVTNAPLYFARALRASLTQNGITITGSAVDANDLPAPLDRANALPLGPIFTTRLDDMARTMMKRSQNLYAESLLRTVAVTSGTTTTNPAAVIGTALNGWGIPSSHFLIVDGSGLSRYDLITPAAVVDVLTHVYQEESLREPFMETLPVAGVDGTLQRRFVGTAAAGNVHAKTGTFSNARGIAGYVWTKESEPLVFTIFTNNYNTTPAAIDAVTDRIVVLLAEFSRGVTRTP